MCARREEVEGGLEPEEEPLLILCGEESPSEEVEPTPPNFVFEEEDFVSQPPRGAPATDPDVVAVRLSFWEALVRPALYTVEETLRREAISVKAWAARRKFGD